jgi:hypothetical protein
MNKETEMSSTHLLSQVENAAKIYLMHHGLHTLLEKITECSDSTGLSNPGYAFLHYFIKKNQPQYLLECGTGISTHLIAKAMKDHCYDKYQGKIKLISLESEKKFFDEAMSIYPEEYRDYLEIRLSPVGYHQYAFLRGTIYKDIPMLPYNFVFVDGPYHQGMCNMDFIRLLEKANDNHVMTAIIDGRKATVLGYQAILGKMSLKFYSPGICYVGPVSKRNLISKNNIYQIFNENIPVSQQIPFMDFDSDFEPSS